MDNNSDNKCTNYRSVLAHQVSLVICVVSSLRFSSPHNNLIHHHHFALLVHLLVKPRLSVATLQAELTSPFSITSLNSCAEGSLSFQPCAWQCLQRRCSDVFGCFAYSTPTCPPPSPPHSLPTETKADR